MPQMMPINWLMSIIYFISIFILFNILNYYNFNTKIKNFKIKNMNNLKNFYWKW